MELIDIAKQFLPDTEFFGHNSFGNGLINSTYIIRSKDGVDYVLQKINSNVFKDVDLLMKNIGIVTGFLAEKGIETISVLHTKDGLTYFEDNEKFFRMYKCISNATSYEKADSFEMIENSASAFGKFHNDLAELDGTKLGETIPFFHDTVKRYKDFLESILKDPKKRVKDCLMEIETIKKYAEYYSLIVDGIKSGDVKLHVTHNDPKINNALFDLDTHKLRAIIDLDTVMPGSVLYDFGDALRSLFTGDKEDALDYKNVVVNFDIYSHYLKAYYSEAKHFLTKREIELLPYSPFILAMELAMRFLKDYIDGDVYFGIHRPSHNLDRARTQINLGISIINNIDKLKKITSEVNNNDH